MFLHKKYKYHVQKISQNICWAYLVDYKLDIKNSIIRINTAFKDYSSTKKVTILPRIYHD